MLFSLGKIYITAGVNFSDKKLYPEISKCIRRHCGGDYGELDEFDKNENSLVLEKGFIHGRIFSRYTLSSGDAIYIITTKVDNGYATTIMLPSEY